MGVLPKSMRLSLFFFALFCVLAVQSQQARQYYFQTLSSPPFEDDNDLEQPLRSTRTVIFSIDTPLFRDEYSTTFLNSNHLTTLTLFLQSDGLDQSQTSKQVMLDLSQPRLPLLQQL